MEQHESSIKNIPYTPSQVYSKLSDLNYVEEIKQRIPVEKLEEVRAQGVNINLDEVTCDTDSITMPVPAVGSIMLAICERDPDKTIKFEVKGVPITANMWIQILPFGEEGSKMKITVRYEVPFFMKMMLKGKLDKVQGGVERFADLLATIKYA